MDEKLKKGISHFTHGIFDTFLNNNLKNINYCRTEVTRKLILLKVVEFYCNNKKLSNENLISLIPDNISSRSHRINCINDLCNKNILKKEQNPEDKRVSLISPTVSTLNEFVQYFDSISHIVTQP
jgi:hypothetical protein